MNNLDKYVEQIKEYIKTNPEITETEIIKYVYIDLGKRFSFDEKFTPFGNSKSKQNHYKYHCKNITDLDECMETNLVICKSVSYILEYILKSLGINIITEIDPYDTKKCPHVYNRIFEKSGRTYIIDLQEDIYNIQTHSFTRNFGIDSIHSMNNSVITRSKQEKIDKKIGYIAENNYYSDDYLYLLHSVADFIDDFDEKLEFILENIEASKFPNMGYIDRQWHHKRVLEEFFDKKDFDYERNNTKIKILDCYKEVEGKRRYLNCISFQDFDKTKIFVYNKKDFRYHEIDLKNFAIAIKNGLVLHNCKISGLTKILKSLNEEDER